MRRRPYGLLLVVLALVSTACGGEEASPAEATGGAVVNVAEVEAAAGAMVTAHGEFEAFVAVFAAFDRGYEVTQVVATAVDGEVALDGTLTDAEGDELEPAGEPLGLFGNPPGGEAGARGTVLAMGAGGAAVAQVSDVDRYVSDLDAWASDVFEAGRQQVRELHEQEEQEAVFQVMVLMLAARGYSPEQILDGMLSGRFRLQGEGSCAYLAGVDGPVVPGRVSVLGEGCAPIPGAGAEDGAEDAEDAPAEDAPAEDAGAGGDFAFEASFEASAEGDSLTANWSGSFTVDEDDGTISGSGAGESTSEGACSIGEGASHPYSFATTWTFAISGTSDGEQLEPIITPDPGSVSTSEGPGTESGALCVDIARDFAAIFAEATLGEQASTDIVVPVGGGTTQIDLGPDFDSVYFEISPVADDN